MSSEVSSTSLGTPLREQTKRGPSEFIVKLAEICSSVNSKTGQWSSDKKQFDVYMEKEFYDFALKRFPNTKKASFTRQLNNYGFHRVETYAGGGNPVTHCGWSFYHEHFIPLIDPKALYKMRAMRGTRKKTIEYKATKYYNHTNREATLIARVAQLEQENELLLQNNIVLKAENKSLKADLEYNKIPDVVKPKRGGLQLRLQGSLNKMQKYALESDEPVSVNNDTVSKPLNTFPSVAEYNPDVVPSITDLNRDDDACSVEFLGHLNGEYNDFESMEWIDMPYNQNDENLISSHAV